MFCKRIWSCICSMSIFYDIFLIIFIFSIQKDTPLPLRAINEHATNTVQLCANRWCACLHFVWMLPNGLVWFLIFVRIDDCIFVCLFCFWLQIHIVWILWLQFSLSRFLYDFIQLIIYVEFTTNQQQKICINSLYKVACDTMWWRVNVYVCLCIVKFHELEHIRLSLFLSRFICFFFGNCHHDVTWNIHCEFCVFKNFSCQIQ